MIISNSIVFIVCAYVKVDVGGRHPPFKPGLLNIGVLSAWLPVKLVLLCALIIAGSRVRTGTTRTGC
ncbi:MAG TPA: hypothetical protein DD666_08820 [Advenella kashmirensis]|uniref:Uncharacterized protein n=1 Tax=Advenella kashmirensis TaxID=310575 RepID=A0A356LER1_9BURK|nr:hypothetical protein [Advenella kashmirensis]